MVKKLLLLIVILITLYGVAIFTAPGIANTVDSVIWMPWLSDTLRGKKSLIEGAITDIPSVDEVKNGAHDFKQKFETGVNSTKDTIDSIREGAQKAEDTYNSAKETYDELKDTLSGAVDMLNDAGGKLEQVQSVVESVSELTGSWSWE